MHVKKREKERALIHKFKHLALKNNKKGKFFQPEAKRKIPKIADIILVTISDFIISVDLFINTKSLISIDM